MRNCVSIIFWIATDTDGQINFINPDLGMPVEDGYALISKIRALSSEQGGNIPAAALTAYVSEKDRLKSLSSGYQIHIAKPVDPTTIAAAVAEIKSKG